MRYFDAYLENIHFQKETHGKIQVIHILLSPCAIANKPTRNADIQAGRE